MRPPRVSSHAVCSQCAFATRRSRFRRSVQFRGCRACQCVPAKTWPPGGIALPLSPSGSDFTQSTIRAVSSKGVTQLESVITLRRIFHVVLRHSGIKSSTISHQDLASPAQLNVRWHKRSGADASCCEFLSRWPQ